MIEIFEKERYYDDSPYTGHCYMYPTYMRKDGKEAFMFNRREPDDAWRISDNERRKQHLIETDGAYMMFNGYKKDPFEMLDIAARRKHHLVQPNDYLRGDYEKKRLYRLYGKLSRSLRRILLPHLRPRDDGENQNRDRTPQKRGMGQSRR